MELDIMGYVYMIINTVNGKAYIGKSIYDPEKRRIKAHLSGHGNRLLADAVKEYGNQDAFTYEVLEANVFDEFLPDLEKAYIAKYNTVAPHGYNLTHGGEGAGRPCDETRQRLPESQFKIYGLYQNNALLYVGCTIRTLEKRLYGHLRPYSHCSGVRKHLEINGQENLEIRLLASTSDKTEADQLEADFIRKLKPPCNQTSNGKSGFRKHSPESIRKMSEAKQGHPVSLETRRKVSIASKGRKQSIETRRKRSEALKDFYEKKGPVQFPKRSPAWEHCDAIIDLSRSGMSQRKIAKRFNCSKSVISAILREKNQS